VQPSSISSSLTRSVTRRDRRVFNLLVLLNVLNLADWFFTVHAINHGATEVNALMAALMSQSYLLAFIFKMGVIFAVTVGIWKMRDERLIRAALIASVSVFVALNVWHVYGYIVYC
jgi:hypothetical protein